MGRSLQKVEAAEERSECSAVHCGRAAGKIYHHSSYNTGNIVIFTIKTMNNILLVFGIFIEQTFFQ